MKRKGIHSSRCWLEGRLQDATVFFEDGIITSIEKGKANDKEVMECGDAVLMPGAIDAHVHVNEPGRTDWEGFESATSAAAAGGITSIIDMPLNASPVTTTPEAFEKKLSATENKLQVHVGFYGGLVPGNQDQLEDLIRAGVLGIKAFLTHSGIDEFPNVGEEELDAVMPVLASHGIPLLVHCEIDNGKMNEALLKHPQSYSAYLASRPKDWENRAIAMMIRLCRRHQCPVHIVHVSSAEALQMIGEAKREGLPLTAETCPHYIYFHAEMIRDGQTLFKCAPPIREKNNNEQLVDALNSGTLDLIGSDHSPAPPSLKEIQSGDFVKAWGGIAGLQFLLSAGWSAMKEGKIEKFIPLLTEHPAQLLRLERKGFIREGNDADLVLWHPEKQFLVKEEAILHKHKISPYVSQQLYGVVERTYVAGELVYHEGVLHKKNAGKWLLRK